jgi:hypothetical protein
MQKYLKGFVGAAIALGAVTANAQLGNGGAKFDGIEQIQGNGANVVEQYIDIAQSAISAQVSLLNAAKLQADADKLAGAGKSLTPEASRAMLEAAASQQSESSQVLAQKLASTKGLIDTAASQQFSTGVLDLARAVTKYAEMSRTVVGMRKRLAEIGAKAAPALYVSRSLPASVKDLSAELKAAVSYAQANNIPLAQEAIDAAAAL